MTHTLPPTPLATGSRILVIDDDPGVRHLIWSALKSAGHSVSTASNTHEARERLSTNQYSLVVTDHDMPRETGMEFVTSLRSGLVDRSQTAADVPVIMMSGNSGADHVLAARGAGISALIQKPFRPNAVASLVHDFVSNGGAARPFVHLVI